MPHAALCVVHGKVRLCEGLSRVSMPHAALWVVQHLFPAMLSGVLPSFNAARGFVGGAAAHDLEKRL